MATANIAHRNHDGTNQDREHDQAALTFHLYSSGAIVKRKYSVISNVVLMERLIPHPHNPSVLLHPSWRPYDDFQMPFEVVLRS